MEHLAKHKTTVPFCILITKTSITQQGKCIITFKNKGKQRLCRLFIVPGDDLATLGMLYGDLQKQIREIKEQQLEKTYQVNNGH